MTLIQSAQHPMIKHFIKLYSLRKYRYEHGRVVIEGRKMIEEVSRFLPIRTLFFSGTNPSISADQIFQVPVELIKKISNCPHPEEMVAEIDMPKNGNLSGCKKILALDKVADPGNMGTLIRTALALGWDGIYLVEGGCDPYNDKALRSAKGSTFHLPIVQGTLDQLKNKATTYHWQVLGGDLHGMPIEALAPNHHPLLLLLGNESQGLSSEALTFCQRVTLPIQNIDSLNVSIAGGILMYLLNNLSQNVTFTR